MRIKYAVFLLLYVTSLRAFTQQTCSYVTGNFTVDKHSTVNVSAIKSDWSVQLFNYENPREGNRSYARHIEKIKEESEKKFTRKENPGNFFKTDLPMSADTPLVVKAFEGNIYENNIPNDNSLAVSNDGMLVSAINCNLNFFDTKNDTLLKKVSLSAFSDTLQLNPDQYDPRLLFDPLQNRFIIVYLSGFVDSTSNIIAGFSQSADPLGAWNLYHLPGNPLADTSWSDFPAIAITKDELFITVNLLKNNESWQNAFKQSVIWQIDKSSGYSGQALQTKQWFNIGLNGKPLRNINPINGGSKPAGPDIYLLSDRNFSIQNDSVFLLRISNVISDNNATLTINTLISDKNYGMPPNAFQPFNNRLQTNDARVLGGFIENNRIQFVGNSIDTLTGFATFFHGIISNLLSSPSLKLNLISDTLEFGYPNISCTGINPANNSSIITVNYSNKKSYPGFCAYYYNGDGEYSQGKILKRGSNIINVMPGADRWGDYSGSQRVYSEPGNVWAAGTFATLIPAGIYSNKTHGTWITKLTKPDDEPGIVIPDHFDLHTYPNPSADIVRADVSIPVNTIIDITLYDISGKAVKRLFSGQATSGKNTLSFSTAPLPNGMYFLTVKDPEKVILTRKIVKGK